MANGDRKVADFHSYELGCKLFYAASWFDLTEESFLLILHKEGLTALLSLVHALEAANPDDCNAPIESWCAAANSELGGKSPAQCVRSGQVTCVRELVQRLGKLPLSE